MVHLSLSRVHRGAGGHVTKKIFIQKMPNLYLQALIKFGGALEKPFFSY